MVFEIAVGAHEIVFRVLRTLFFLATNLRILLIYVLTKIHLSTRGLVKFVNSWLKNTQGAKHPELKKIRGLPPYPKLSIKISSVSST